MGGGCRKACLSARAQKGRRGGGREQGETGRGFSIMKFEICRTSKGSVSKPLWQQSKEEEYISYPLSPPPSPHTHTLFPAIAPSVEMSHHSRARGCGRGKSKRMGRVD